MGISQTTVGWLLLAAAALAFVAGLALRSFVGRRRETEDDAELDDKILMPTFVLGCGLCLTAIFLLGYEALA
jgi:Kef-type K+ transport system membrane component KefB